MSMYGYQTLDNYPDDKKFKFAISHHAYHISEYMENLENYAKSIKEKSRENDIYGTIRAISQMKSNSESLTNTLDHLLRTIQPLVEPDHGGM